MKFLKEIEFYKIHVFKYSVRKGTKAAEFINQILPEIKEARSKEVIKLSSEIQNKYNKLYIGRTVKVLVEEKQDNYYKGHTENYICVYIETEEELENKIVEVEIKKVKNENLIGELKIR